MELFPYVDLKNQLARKLDSSAVGAPGGAAKLGSDGRVPFAQLPQTLAELTGAVEYRENKGKPGGYASLNGSGTVPSSQLPSSFLPKFASVEQAADPGVTDRIISPMTLHEVVGQEVSELTSKIEAVRARVPDWEEGKTYPVDSVVQRHDILWRAKETTDAAPGPETLEVNANDSTFFTNTAGEAGVEDEITARVPTQKVFYSTLIPAAQLNGMKVTFEMAYARKGYGWDEGNHFGLYWGSNTTSWTTENNLNFTGDDVVNSGATFVQYEMLFYRTGLGLAAELSADGVLQKTVEVTSRTDFLDSRFRTTGFGAAYKLRNFKFQFGGAGPEWEILSHVRAARYFRDLEGIPLTYPPAAHDASLITSGTVAAARLPDATESAKGIVERATLAEVTTGTDTTRFVTPKGVKQETDKVRADMTALVNNTIVPITRADYDALPTPRPAGTVYIFTD